MVKIFLRHLTQQSHLVGESSWLKEDNNCRILTRPNSSTDFRQCPVLLPFTFFSYSKVLLAKSAYKHILVDIIVSFFIFDKRFKGRKISVSIFLALDSSKTSGKILISGYLIDTGRVVTDFLPYQKFRKNLVSGYRIRSSFVFFAIRTMCRALEARSYKWTLLYHHLAKN